MTGNIHFSKRKNTLTHKHNLISFFKQCIQITFNLTLNQAKARVLLRM